MLQVIDLAMWLETAKMRSNITGNLLGGALLGDIMSRMTSAVEASNAGSQVRCRIVT